ncbi:MAG: hypothetical protein WCK91_02140 [bacterium]
MIHLSDFSGISRKVEAALTLHARRSEAEAEAGRMREVAETANHDPHESGFEFSGGPGSEPCEEGAI